MSIQLHTNDVKGTIDPMGGEYVKTTVANSEGNFEPAVIRFQSFEVVIMPTTKSFDELYTEYKERSEVFGDFFVLEMGKDFLLYKEQRGFSGRKKETYTMLLLSEGKTRSYLLEGKGRLLDPMMHLEDAKKSLEVARTFVPAD